MGCSCWHFVKHEDVLGSSHMHCTPRIECTQLREPIRVSGCTFSFVVHDGVLVSGTCVSTKKADMDSALATACFQITPLYIRMH
jgi:hypothetical protein